MKATRLLFYLFFCLIINSVICKSQNATSKNNKFGCSLYSSCLFLNKVTVENSNYDSIVSKNKPGIKLSVNVNYKIKKNIKLETGVGFTQRQYSYDYYNNNCKKDYRFFTQEIKYNYMYIPLSIIYEKALTTKLSGFGILSFCYNFSRNYKNKVDNYNNFYSFIPVYDKHYNFYSYSISLGINDKISEKFKIPVAIFVEKTNFKSIGNTQTQELMINSTLLGIRTGICIN